MKIFVFVYKMATSHCINQQHHCWSSSLTHICGTRDESISRNTVDRICMSYLWCLRLPISNCWPEGMIQNDWSDRTIHRGNPNHDLKVMIVWGVQDILPSGPSKTSRWFSLCSVANEQRCIECLFHFNEHHRNDLNHTYLRSCYHPLLLYHKISQQILLHLTHWDRVTHICDTKLNIGSNNGLSPGLRQSIIWTNDGILLIRTIGANFSEILIKIDIFPFKKLHLKLSSGNWRPFSLGLNVLSYTYTYTCTPPFTHLHLRLHLYICLYHY